MFRTYDHWKLGILILGIGIAAIGEGGRALAWQDPAEATDPVVEQVQTRGPVHEAFAGPVVYDPGPGPVVPREPAPPVEEQPPDQKPEGDDVQWIAGYWGWDEDRGDFLWVSGIWRLPPPGHQWVPGYWNQVEGGWQWTHGVWTPVDQGDASYLPTPPASIESGPNCEQPAADSIWSPGCWLWSESRYVWRPGCWVAHQPDWNWVPTHYASTPCGSLFVEGYWDYPVEQRGVLYAPVFFPRLLLARPDFVYCPSVCIPEAALVSSLFVQPSCNQYRFGDYYDANNFQAGIYPWYSYHQSRYGYDPIYSFYSAAHCRDSGWAVRIHEEYRYRRENQFARPPHTLAEQPAYQHRPSAGKFGNLAMTSSISHLMDQHQRPLHIEKLGPDRRKELAQQGKQLHQIGQKRAVAETAAAKRSGGKSHQVTKLKLPSSPIGATKLTHHSPMGTSKTGQHPPTTAPTGKGLHPIDLGHMAKQLGASGRPPANNSHATASTPTGPPNAAKTATGRPTTVPEDWPATRVSRPGGNAIAPTRGGARAAADRSRGELLPKFCASVVVEVTKPSEQDEGASGPHAARLRGNGAATAVSCAIPQGHAAASDPPRTGSRRQASAARPRPQRPDPHPSLPPYEHRNAGHPQYGYKNGAPNSKQRTPAQPGRPGSRTSVPTRSPQPASIHPSMNAGTSGPRESSTHTQGRGTVPRGTGRR